MSHRVTEFLRRLRLGFFSFSAASCIACFGSKDIVTSRPFNQLVILQVKRVDFFHSVPGPHFFESHTLRLAKTIPSLVFPCQLSGSSFARYPSIHCDSSLARCPEDKSQSIPLIQRVDTASPLEYAHHNGRSIDFLPCSTYQIVCLPIYNTPCNSIHTDFADDSYHPQLSGKQRAGNFTSSPGNGRVLALCCADLT